MFILNFDELFAESKLNKKDFIICHKEEALNLLQHNVPLIGKYGDCYVFIKLQEDKNIS